MESNHSRASKSLLIGWGYSRAVSFASNGYPREAAFARYMLNPGESFEKGLRRVPLDDDVHDRVDSAVSSMKPHKPIQHTVLCLAYIGSLTDHEIGERMKLSRSTVRGYRESAESWVESRLAELLEY